MRGSDFRHFFNYLKRNHPNPPTYEEARNLYFNHYSCKCESCTYREQNGFVPIRANNSQCTCPLGVPPILQELKR